MSYSKAYSYNGHAIIVTLTLNTGSVESAIGNGAFRSEPTHTITVSDDGNVTEVDGVKSDDLLVTAAQLEDGIKGYIDGVADTALAAAIIDAGYSDVITLNAPENFVANTGIATGYIDMMWDNDTNADTYVMYRADDAEFTINSGLLYTGIYSNSFSDTGRTTGQRYYYKLVSQIAGVTSSPASYADAIAG